MRVCKILAFSIYEGQLCHCNWWPEIQKWQFLPPPSSTQKLQTFTVFSCHRFSKKFSLPDRRARFHRFPGYLVRIFFIGLIISERPDGQSCWMLTALGKIEKWLFLRLPHRLRFHQSPSYYACLLVTVTPFAPFFLTPLFSPVVKMRPHSTAHPH